MNNTAEDSISQQQEFDEDKKCRICGFADTKNINIFSPGSCKQLVTKILTVYPIVLYKNDPLPKNICRKCVSNVCIMYNDVLRVMKMQIKWINNVRMVQPHHNYIRVLEMIQEANTATRNSIKATLAEDVNALNVSRLLIANKLESSPKVGEKNESGTNDSKSFVKPVTSLSFSMDFDDGVTLKSSPLSSSTPKAKHSPTKSNKIKDIKSILEKNGCSLLQVHTNQSSVNKNKTTVKVNTFAVSTPDNIKNETVENEDSDDNILLSLLSKSSKEKVLEPPGPPPPLTVKCRYCPLQFNSLILLASHQLIHMRLCLPKIFQKKYLHKRVRRGRLISVQERKCIRCLNCWRIFVDNKSILEHWAVGECDFYCHICGEEFAQAPKLLREHVPAVHGISYKSSKFHRTRLSNKIMMSMTQTPIEENTDFKLYQAVSEQEPLPYEELGGRSELSQPKAVRKKKVRESMTFPKLENCSKLPASNIYASTSKTSSELPHNEDGFVKCHICLLPFQNIKARNSHMRKHKPVYAYGDMVLPPSKDIEKYDIKPGESDTNGDSTTALGTYYPTVPNKQEQNSDSNSSEMASNQTPSAIPNTNCTNSTKPLRGVRTKFVKPRTEQDKIVIAAGGNRGETVKVDSSGISAHTALKVKPLNELQKPIANELNICSNASSSKPSASFPNSTPFTSIPSRTITEAARNQIKTETMDVDSSNQKQIFTCIPCSNQFPSKLELFRHKRKCRANFIINCEQCSQSFRCSADYQLHASQNHNYVHNSNYNV